MKNHSKVIVCFKNIIKELEKGLVKFGILYAKVAKVELLQNLDLVNLSREIVCQHSIRLSNYNTNTKNILLLMKSTVIR